MKPFCFVLMPFGPKKDEGGREIDFNRIYDAIIKPAINDAEMEPIRADKEIEGGIIHKPMFERLMLCDYAVADLTTANANVFYELGIRHGARPRSTVTIFAEGMKLPFDIALLRCLPYRLDGAGVPTHVAEDRAALRQKLEDARQPIDDSPVYQLVGEWPKPDLARLKTDRFRELVAYSQTVKSKLADARGRGAAAIDAVRDSMSLADTDAAILIDLFLSYRAVSAFQSMVDLAAQMPEPVARSVMVREQLGLALNRLGRGDEAERVLTELIAQRGPNSETNGILGRVYKDRWDEAKKAGNGILARGVLRKAIDTYLAGFEADWRDAYPGINAVTLMEMMEPVDARQAALLPVVRYAVQRRLISKKPDYWDYATLLELAVLAGDAGAAEIALTDALAAVRETWEPQTTARNLGLIRDARAARGIDAAWIEEIIQALLSGG